MSSYAHRSPRYKAWFSETRLSWLRDCKDGKVFDKALTGCRITLTALNLEVGKLVEPKPQQGKIKEGPMEMKFCAKVKLIWKEDVMKHLLEHTRGLMVSLHFIITLLERYNNMRTLYPNHTSP